MRTILNKYGVLAIDSDYEESIFTYSQIFWDFRVKLRQHDIILLFEIETERKDPEGNVIKTLIWLNENNINDNIIFFHFFDSSYTQNNTPAKDICGKLVSYISTEYKKSFKYSPHQIDELKNIAQAKKKIKAYNSVNKRISELIERVVKIAVKSIGKKSK